MPRERVLCVDDEPTVLAVLGRALRDQFDVIMMSSAQQALELFTNGTFALAISDYQMPEMNGVEFLSRVRARSPDTVRIMLTGQGNLEAAAAAVNEGQIFRFLQKPISIDDLRTAAAAGAAQHRLITAERVLLEQTLHGSVKALMDVLSLVEPQAFGRATRIKRLAAEIAEVMQLPDRWQLELAALLSQLGSISLAPATATKVAKRQPLSREEELQLSRVPSAAANLIDQIPRLEGVRAILREQAALSGHKDARADVSPAVRSAAQVLRIAFDFDLLEERGMPASAAVDTLSGRRQTYGSQVVDALGKVRGAEASGATIREIPLADVSVRMIFAADVVAQNGVLLVARGQEVTPSLVERIRVHWRDFAGQMRVPMIVASPPALASESA